MGHDAVVDNRGVPRPIYTDPEIASVGLTEQAAREQYGDDVVTGSFPWVANGRAIMQNETTGWVKTIHESRYGEFLGSSWSVRTSPTSSRPVWSRSTPRRRSRPSPTA
jgi:dihydrolipoamide dehydrogenase